MGRGMRPSRGRFVIQKCGYAYLAGLLPPDFVCEPPATRCRGNCARLLREPSGAIASLEHGLRTISLERAGHRSGVLADLAAAYALPGQSQDVQQACAPLVESLNLADHSGASVARQRISGILWHELHPWASTPPVRELNERVTFEGAGPS